MKHLDKNPTILEYIKEIEIIRFEDVPRLKEILEKLKIESINLNSTYGLLYYKIYICDYYLLAGETKLALTKLLECIEECINNNYVELAVTGYNFVGNAYFDLGDTNNALDSYLKALGMSIETNLIEAQISLNNNIANMFLECKSFDTALPFLLKASEAYDKIATSGVSNTKLLASILYTNLCMVYMHKKQFALVQKYLDKCKEIDTLGEETLVFIALCEAKLLIGNNKCANIEKQVSLTFKLLNSTSTRNENVIEIIKTLSDILFYVKDREYIEELLCVIQRVSKFYTNTAHLVFFLTIYLRYLEAFKPNDEALLHSYRQYFDLQNKFKIDLEHNNARALEVKIALFEANIKRNKIIKQQKRLKQISTIDELCNICNRRGLRKELTRIYNKALSNNKSIAVILLDIDYFKEYNDNYGHLAGDKVLKRFSSIIKKYSANKFLPARFGGDEFMCVGYDLSDMEVDNYIQLILNALNSANIPHNFSKIAKKQITFSAGYINKIADEEDSISDLINKSDIALYFAKQNGRNTFIGNPTAELKN